jgi:hypothetical protein
MRSTSLRKAGPILTPTGWPFGKAPGKAPGNTQCQGSRRRGSCLAWQRESSLGASQGSLQLMGSGLGYSSTVLAMTQRFIFSREMTAEAEASGPL